MPDDLNQRVRVAPPFNPDDILHRRTVESHRVELKSGWNPKIGASVARTVCAFANDLLHLNGGYIVLGVEEVEGRPVLPPRGLAGLDLERVQKELFGFCKRIHPEYQPYYYPLEFMGRPILMLWTPGGENRPYQAPEDANQKGSPMQAYVRTGPQTIKAKGEVLRQLIELTAQVPFDDRRHLGAHVEQISPLLVRGFLREIGSQLVEQEPIDDLDLYRRMRLLKKVNAHEVPRNFALLFFNEEPHEFFRGAWVEVAQFPEGAGGDVIEERSFHGPLHYQIKQVLNYLEGLGGTLIRKIKGKAKAQHSVAYPFEAVEETVVNAVYHRGYDDPPEPLKIYIYPDRMVITSYPGPVPGLRLDDFRPGAVVPPVAGRNRRIGELLKELDLAEAKGTGIPKIQHAMRRNGSPAAQFDFDEETRTYFSSILPIHPDHQRLPGARAEEPGKADVTPGVLRPAMRTTIGIPARGSNFLPREAELRELWHWAVRGHVLMLAPRRVGKTSLLYHLRDQPEMGWSCLFMSVEALDGEAQFVARLLAELHEAWPSSDWQAHFGTAVSTALQKVDDKHLGFRPFHVELAEAVGDDWQEVGATALRVMKELHGNTLVLVDEFPIFVRRLLAGPEGMPRTRLFLDWFRETRNLQDGDARVHFVLSGSLGLDVVVRSVGMSATINDLATFRLGPLSDELADELLVRLAAGEELPLSAELRRRIRSHIEWPIPFHLQLIFAKILNRTKFHGRTLDEELIDESYAALLSPESRSYFEHWVDRLDETLLVPEERDLTRALLRAAAHSPKGLDDSSIVEIRKKVAPDIAEEVILATLENDGYLTREGERWRFASSLLRDWWLKWQMRGSAELRYGETS